MAVSVLCFSFLSKNFLVFTLFEAVLLFVLLKGVLHFLIYKTTKYKDDGRDLVNMIDFVCIHCTFPAINAWVTYQTLYVLFMTIAAVCPEKYSAGKRDLVPDLCNKYRSLNTDIYYYAMMVFPSKIAFVVIFIEMAVFIAYYKDIVFSTITLINFCGMYYNSYKKLDDADKHWFWRSLGFNSSYGNMNHPMLTVVGSVADNSFNSAKEIHQWLIGMMMLNITWIVVTLITDWQTCFYRKAAVYKRRVENAIEQRRQQQAKAQEKIQNESATSMSGSIVNNDGLADKSMIKKQDGVNMDELLKVEDPYQNRSESFRRYVQYQELQENVEYKDHEDELDGQLKRDQSPTLFRRESKQNIAFQNMLQQQKSIDYNAKISENRISSMLQKQDRKQPNQSLIGVTQSHDKSQEQMQISISSRYQKARKSNPGLISQNQLALKHQSSIELEH